MSIEVKMKTLACSERGVWQPGQVITIEEAEAADLVAGGYAEYIKPPSLPGFVEPEKAVIEPDRAVLKPQPKKPSSKKR